MKLALWKDKPGPSLGDLLVDNDIISVNDGVVVMAEKTTTPKTRELGSAGTSWNRLMGTGEYNSALAGYSGLVVYDKMRRSDATVRSSLRLAKTPVLSGNWYVDAGESDDEEALKQAEFVEYCLFRHMTIDWSQILQEALLMLDFGWYSFELVFELVKYEGENRWVWKKWGPRHPMDAEEFKYDGHGGPKALITTGWDGTQGISIPIEDLIVFTFDREANNMEGISILRSAYKSWYFKDNLYKIDAIQKERHGIGIPVIRLPINWNESDKLAADELGRNLRTNESAHVVLPPGWELLFAKVEGNPVDAMVSVEHHDKQIAKNVLAQFLNTGAAASKEQEIDLYTKATRFTADIVRNAINKYAIPQLVDYNWPGVTKYPELKVRRLGEVRDLRTLSFAVRNLVGANIILPDERLEIYLRDEMDLPRLDAKTTREIATPQAPNSGAPGAPKPPRVGMPRQGKPSAKQGQGTGVDRSGG